MKTPWQRLSELLNLDRAAVTQLYLYALFSGIVALSLPLGIQSVIHFIQAGQVSTSWFILILLVIGGVVLTGVLQIMQLRIMETIQQRIYVRYSFDFAYRFPRINRAALDDKIPGELMNRFFDVVSLQKGISKVLLDLSSALLLIVFSLLVLSFYHPFYIAFSLALVTLIYIVFRPIMRRGIRTSLEESKHKYKTAYWLQEIARADWSFRLAPSGNHSLDKLDTHANDYLSSREAHFKVLWAQYIWMIALKSIAVAALLGLGGYLVIDQQMNLGQFVAAEILILLILGAVEKIIQLLETVYDVFTSLEKLGQVQDLPMSFEYTADAISGDAFFPVEVIDISQERINIVLRIDQLERVFIEGCKEQESVLLLRSLVDAGVSETLRPRWNNALPHPEMIAGGYAHVGWFTPDTYLFEGTIRENILLGRTGIDNAQLRKALETVDLHENLSGRTAGYETIIREGLHSLSVNERERVLLARAIVHSPTLLLISFFGSSLTGIEQGEVLNRIAGNYPGATIVCAAPGKSVAAWKSITVTINPQ